MRAIDIFAIAVAVVIALLSLVVEAWSTQWWTALITAAIIALAAGAHMFFNAAGWFKGRLGMALAVLGTALIIIGGIVGLFGAFKIDGEPRSTERLTDKPSLLSMFVRDLKPSVGFEIYGCSEYDHPDRKGRTYYKIIGDVAANSKFLSFYIPTSQYSLRIMEFIADEYNEWIVDVENTLHVHNNVQGNTSPVHSQNMIFSNVIYVYHDDALDAVQIGDLTKKFNDKNLTLQLRSLTYVMGAWDAIKAGRISKVAQYEMAGCRILPVKSS